jgi:phosphatidylglycerophosphatase B
MRFLTRPYLALMICCASLFAIPLFAWGIHWSWNANDQSALLWWFYLLTQTVSKPFGFITSALMLFVLIYTLNIRRGEWLKFALVMLLPVIVGQVAVSEIKKTNQEPRPYVVWLSQTDTEIDRHFYQDAPVQRQQLITQRLVNNTQIPDWQKQHWLQQVDPAFPSGHTIFAATWALMAVALLVARGRWLLASVVVIWAYGVIISRLALGMHWPGDLFTSIMIALYLSLPAVWWWLRWRSAGLNASATAGPSSRR